MIGGAIVDQASWRWIFFVNLPSRSSRWCSRGGSCLARRQDAALRSTSAASSSCLRVFAIFVCGMSEAGMAGGLGDGRRLAGIAVGLDLVAAFGRHARQRGRA